VARAAGRGWRRAIARGSYAIEREPLDSAVRQLEFLVAEITDVELLIAAEALSWSEVN
jgi:hypothetical protein